MLMKGFWKEKEYLALLESEGVDTCCFMGSGFEFEEYLVGQEFYLPYAYYSLDARNLSTYTIEELVKFLKGYYKKERLITDRYKLVKKKEYRVSPLNGRKYYIERCEIKNLRSGDIIWLRDKEVDRFFWFLMAEPK